MDKTGWRRTGLLLSTALKSSQWDLGDWYHAGRETFGAGYCKGVVCAASWKGVEFPALLVYASIAKRYDPVMRIKDASFSHHQLAAPLPHDVALPLLRQAANENWNTNKMREEVGRIRFFKELVGGDIFDDLNVMIQQKRRYRAILIDPPWPWNTGGGKAGATGPHYAKMTMEELYALPVAQIATDDAFLFLWVPPALLDSKGLPLMRAWGFSYRNGAVWDKGNFGRGSYFRMEHEHLLLCVREGSPTHFNDNSCGSMIRTPHSGNNSEKPEDAHRIVERAIGGPYLELFARRHIPGWDCHGNQLAPLAISDGTPHLLAAD